MLRVWCDESLHGEAERWDVHRSVQCRVMFSRPGRLSFPVNRIKARSLRSRGRLGRFGINSMNESRDKSNIPHTATVNTA